MAIVLDIRTMGDRSMSNVERVMVMVPKSVTEELREAAAAGECALPREAACDAVRVRSESRRLRQAWDAGKAGGLHGPIDFGALREEARMRLATVRNEAGG